MVEIIPRPVVKSPRWINILFYISLVVLILMFFSYFILTSSVKKSQKTIQTLKEDIAKEETVENNSLEKEVFRLDKKIKDFSSLIEKHIISSNFFTLVEKLTYPSIWFSQLNLNSKDGKAVLSGHADSFAGLGYQLQILLKEPLIQSVSLDQISISKRGEVDFSLNITFDQEVSKWQKIVQ